jgi:hypothetical protein
MLGAGVNSPINKYSAVHVTLRPPRAVVLFPDDDGYWHGWAMLALRTASSIWGGGGFILAGYAEDGTVPAPVANAVVDYDPDHVIVMKPSVADAARIENRHPRSFLSDPAQWTENTSAATNAANYEDRAALRAAEQLASMCTLMETTDGEKVLLSASGILRVKPGEGAGPLVPVTVTEPVIAIDEAWTEAAPLWAAVEVGVAPSPDGDPRPAPDAEAIYRWLFRHQHDPVPDELLHQMGLASSSIADGKPRWFDAPDPTLTLIGQGPGTTYGALVVGDTAADFCLAVAYKRMLGTSLWLTTSALHSLSAPTLLELEAYITDPSRPGEPTCVTSASLTTFEIANTVSRLDHTLFPNPSASDGAWRGEPTLFTAPPINEVRFGLTLDNMIDESATLPVLVSDDGTVSLTTELTLPIPNRLWNSERGKEHPYWYVDVDVDGRLTPPGHGLGAKHMLETKHHGRSVQMMRSSRNGVSLLSQRQGFVDGQSLMISRMVRPQLRYPSMSRWVIAKAEDGQHTAKHSTPGVHTNLIASRLGGRRAFFDLSRHPSFAALHLFSYLPKAARTDRIFPLGGGIVLERTPYLSAGGVSREAGADDAGLTDLLDRLVEANLIRRGLILGCEECARASFVSVDDLGHRYACVQCGHVNSLVSKSWNSTNADPTWYFDLHARFREWWTTNGLVPLLAARELAQHARVYDDVAEIEFAALDSTRPRMEIDLIARMDGDVVLVEAKKAGSLGTASGRSRAIAKLLDAAVLLQADRLYLATTQPVWPVEELEHVRSEAARRPSLKSLTVEALLLHVPGQCEPGK